MNCWILVYPAPDLANVWIGHNISFDVISQGTTPHHALEMVKEASIMFAEHELAMGRSPWCALTQDL